MGEDQSDDLELDGPITMRILDGIAWDFAQAKWWRWWKTVRCGDSILSYCPRNPHGKAGNEERRRRKEEVKPFYFNYILYFRFPLHSSTGEARPHLPPLTARPCTIAHLKAILILVFIKQQRKKFTIDLYLSEIDDNTSQEAECAAVSPQILLQMGFEFIFSPKQLETNIWCRNRLRSLTQARR